uniref:Dystroglycan-type cadherin-like domain-containing protein n=1 Tax=Megaselia scalaris TaxID=36166 RepID=T1GQ97_MEGSC
MFRFFLLVFIFLFQKSTSIEQGTVGEVFVYKITPELFVWNKISNNSKEIEFRFRPTLKDHPELPSWIGYIYSKQHKIGYLYGTPPEKLADKKISLDIVALNKKTYETKAVILDIFINSKLPAPNEVQLRIHNFNLIQLLEPAQITNLMNVFKLDLWTESYKVSSETWGRVPLTPNDKEGVIVHLSSSALFSGKLKDLQEEVRPLYKHSSCNYKRTSVQKIFENVGFKLDWCAFRIVGKDIAPEVLYHQQSSLLHQKASNNWIGLKKKDVFERNYIDEIAISLAVPGVLFTIGFVTLFSILCLKSEKLGSPYPQGTSTVQMVQCSENQTTTTLKSLNLKDSNALLDNLSYQSQSPNNSQSNSPGNTYLRPKPPAYGTLGRNSTSGGVHI